MIRRACFKHTLWEIEKKAVKILVLGLFIVKQMWKGYHKWVPTTPRRLGGCTTITTTILKIGSEPGSQSETSSPLFLVICISDRLMAW